MRRGRVLARSVQVTGAVLLCGGYLQDVLLTLQSLSIHRDTQGTWQVLSDPTSVSRNWTLAAFFMISTGLVAFATGYLFHRRSTNNVTGSVSMGGTDVTGTGGDVLLSRLTWRHLCLALGWVGLLFFGGMYAYYLGLGAWVPTAWRQSAGIAALGSVSMQIAAIVAIPLYYRRATHEIGLCRPVLTWRMVGYVLMFFIAIFALSLLTHSLGTWLGINTNSYREQNISRELHTAWWQGSLVLKLLPMLATSLIAPLGEELMFRGAVQSTVTTKWGPLAGILLSSLLFALVHADVVLFLPLFVMGLLFGILRWLSGSVWAPMWLHALNNFYASLVDLL